MIVHLFFALTVSIRSRLLFPTLCGSIDTKSMFHSEAKSPLLLNWLNLCRLNANDSYELSLGVTNGNNQKDNLVTKGNSDFVYIKILTELLLD
jgi:hypothetical protein